MAFHSFPFFYYLWDFPEFFHGFEFNVFVFLDSAKEPNKLGYVTGVGGG